MFYDLFLLVLLHWVNCKFKLCKFVKFACMSAFSSNFLLDVLLSSGLLSFVIIIVVIAWVDISRHVCDGLGHNESMRATYAVVYAIAWLAYIGYQWIDANAYIMYSWEFSMVSLYISTLSFLSPCIDCHYYVFISKQLSDIYWIQPTMIWRDTVIHHTSERILVTLNLFALYALFMIHLLTYTWTYVFMRPYSLLTIYIYIHIYIFENLSLLFSISTLVAL